MFNCSAELGDIQNNCVIVLYYVSWKGEFMSTTKIVYFRDRAKEFGCNNVYELIDPSKPFGVPLDPFKPQGERNLHKVNDISVWKYIIENQ
jgi:hypothetical protein